jgi:peptidyl-prolyl cis-trans isomerase B (cyclophilin B)
MFGIRDIAVGMMVAAGLSAAGGASAADPPAKAAAPAASKAAAAGEEVAILETSRGRMVVEFWEKDAPKTVANFKKLARQGYFDGTGFHRIIKGFMVQAGDPKSKNPKAPDLGTGDPGYKIPDEFNARKHVKGVLSMANSGTPNSAGSQFFIMHAPAAHLDGKYTGFGRLIEGMDVLDAIANSPTGPNAMMGGEKSRPLEWTTMKSVKIAPKASMAAAGKAKSAATASKPKPSATKVSAHAKGTAVETKAADAPAKAEEPKAAATPAVETNPAAESTPAPPDTSKAGSHDGHNH